MDLLNFELGSSNETQETSTLDKNEVTGIEAERVSEVAHQETMTIPTIKTEPDVSCWSVLSFTYISYRLYPNLCAPISVCPCETKLDWEIDYAQI